MAGKLHSDAGVLRWLAHQLASMNYQVSPTTSANCPWLLDGMPMSEGQFHATAHRIVFPGRSPPHEVPHA